MRRDAMQQLYDWKEKTTRKPLIVRGARQVGKTWLMKEFASSAYRQFAYINFEDNEVMKDVFQKDFDVERILMAIQLVTGIVVDTETLIIFDEIQEAPRGLTALKYFQEKAPQYHVVAAGSLLGIAMHSNDSFPVGKVDFIDLYPLSFSEFLEAVGQEAFARLLAKKDWGLIAAFRSKLIDLLKQYYYVGGMPEVVNAFINHKDYAEVRQLQQAILDSYDRDFSKHAPIAEVPRIRMIWRSVPAQLAKENKKFVYGVVKEGARAKDFELAIEWLIDAGLIYKVSRVKKAGIPLSAYEDFSAFKLFLLDTGLMGAMSGLPPQALLEGNVLFSDYKGAITEQYVLQQLKSVKGLSIYYWSSDTSRGELDFLLQKDVSVIPVEVKAEENLQSKSLRFFVEKNAGLHGVRFSMSDYREQEWMINYPLYSVGYIL
ncbi:ATP-binding protein [Bacteroides thetaiotaomicron]|uniref:ATP-binding protein n=1 Tax=Bacteroides thetaiotaomicron TaxID=818 RepID=UPI002166274E|nr:ATP-binding protein [Bacteroides thetaiotaomicron]MCS2292746.1 ATP-binding protein [Bacteroides thetaiotaomicron]